MPSYAIISLGGKQYRVREGERLLVDRLPYADGKTFHPQVLLLGGNGNPELAPKEASVTVRVVGQTLGDKIRIGKYRPKTGYRRHTGHRARLSQIQIESIGKKETRKREPKAKDGEPKASASKTSERQPTKKKAE